MKIEERCVVFEHEQQGVRMAYFSLSKLAVVFFLLAAAVGCTQTSKRDSLESKQLERYFENFYNSITNYLINTFQLFHNNRSGTCFRMLMTRNYIYFVTAAHLVPTLKDGQYLQINSPKGKINLKVHKVVHNFQGDVSIFVVKNEKKERRLEFNNFSNKVSLGEDIWVLGFPLGIGMSITKIKGKDVSILLPIIKKGVISAVYHSTNKPTFFLIDALVNQGFSGGVVVFRNRRNGVAQLLGIPIKHLKDKINGKLIDVNSGIGIITGVSVVKELLNKARRELNDTK